MLSMFRWEQIRLFHRRTSFPLALRCVFQRVALSILLILISDFRDAGLLPGESRPPALSVEISGVSRRHDLVAAVVTDPREEEIPAAGPFRIADPESPGGTFTVASGSHRLRPHRTPIAPHPTARRAPVAGRR